MNRLPTEIISQIVGHVRHRNHPLTPLSLINHYWQPIVEVEIYRQFYMGYELPENTYMSYKRYADVLTPTRLSYIRQLCVYFYISGHFSAEGRHRHSWSLENTAKELEKALKHFFNLLTSTPHGQEPLLDLYFDACGPTDLFGTDPRPCESLYGLPELPMIRFFQFFQGSRDEVFSPHALLLVASKMPRLRELDIEISPRLVEVSSTHQRMELARSLAEVPLPTSLQNFTLRYYPTTGPDGFPTTENDEDILTRELRRLSQREGLEYLAFYGRVEPSIFWPPHSVSEPQQWPTLKAFTLDLYQAQQFSWLSNGESLDVVEGADERGQISKAIFNAFCQALAKCSAHMPKAEHTSIEFNDNWDTSLVCIVVSGNRFIELKGKPDLTLELDKETVDEWRKTADVHNLDSEMRIVERDRAIGH
ncbi:uncharacterized protein B0J16DRAFT_402652 [Fusarium flagelliforme]|uniref:F-box domain-containing protein n=1 Tax=Fusarium flagelliforme TaxID=2675880 RepID=A0A395M8A6_9HYPO|nr:uncharacterized protein B0J16DRAFT_402652 [Fusarium flagelliforme]KAH7179249.1 hypothetical protein B0J16DRAFT_402652 [Fusarium flagelliforme]RFN44098.1 hypothetical protein FIE12Z_11646 [Fusarium flagelliforme]